MTPKSPHTLSYLKTHVSLQVFVYIYTSINKRLHNKGYLNIGEFLTFKYNIYIIPSNVFYCLGVELVIIHFTFTSFLMWDMSISVRSSGIIATLILWRWQNPMLRTYFNEEISSREIENLGKYSIIVTGMLWRPNVK